jgi:hypothetical protein
MKRISIIVGLCLVSAVALSAIAASSASAVEPTLLLRLTKGEFPVFYALKTDGNDHFETESGLSITCLKTEGDGSFETAHLGFILLEMTGCEAAAPFNGGMCNTVEAGSKEGLVMLDDWVDHFGGTRLGAGKEVPGLLLLTNAKFEIECHTILGIVKAAVTTPGTVGRLQTAGGELPKVNTPLKAYNIEFKGEKGIQEYKEFLFPLKNNELFTYNPKVKVDGGAEQPVGLTSTSHIEKLENSKHEPTEVEIIEG